jgi:hypothetical protein
MNMSSRHIAALEADHAPTVRGSEFEIMNERIFAAEQSRLEEQAEIRARVVGERYKENSYERMVREERSAYLGDLI